MAELWGYARPYPPGETDMSKTEGYNIVFRLPGGRTGTRITYEANEESAKAYIAKKYPNSEIAFMPGPRPRGPGRGGSVRIRIFPGMDQRKYHSGEEIG